jgi:RsiW-degrading membrane proteinase PrsW (M82 family)
MWNRKKKQKKKLTKQQLLNSNIRANDVLIVLGLLLMIFARVLTMTYISAIVTETKANIEAVNNLYEANPFAKMTLRLRSLGTLIQMVMIPAFGLATYIYFRKKAKEGKLEVMMLSFFVNLYFFTMVLDVINNLALVFGKMI